MTTEVTPRLVRPAALEKTFANLDQATTVLVYRTKHHLLARPFHGVTRLTAKPSNKD